MFAAERWARVFLAASSNQEEALAALKALSGPVLSLRGVVSGSSAAFRLEAMLNAAVKAGGLESGCAAVRLLVLLVKKGFLRHLPRLIREIENIYEAENRIQRVLVESAFPLEDKYLDTLQESVMRYTCAREVRMSVRIIASLLGGCRLRLGSQCLDASLRGQLQKMAVDLQAAGGFAW
ncbi:MAG: F0F1 ATP synthase subunit delta [Spirochaetales bacterium]|jgi:F-type H+-transporting ATPase subunit delta|nr:F0F1 ATP synthase subunit delta [Spirochaetales bacterium]